MTSGKLIDLFQIIKERIQSLQYQLNQKKYVHNKYRIIASEVK